MQMRRASFGHWRSAALWVKKVVGSPSMSTMAPLLESVLPCAAQTGGIMQYSVGEGLSFTANHVLELLN